MASKKRDLVSSSNEDWRTESDMRALIEAQQIKSDPKRLAAAQAMAKKRMLEVAAVATTEAE